MDRFEAELTCPHSALRRASRKACDDEPGPVEAACRPRAVIYRRRMDIIGRSIMRVAKWGNSLAVRLPKALVEELGLATGDEIEVHAKAPGELIVGKDMRRHRAVERMRRRAWALPDGYVFDRNAAHER